MVITRTSFGGFIIYDHIHQATWCPTTEDICGGVVTIGETLVFFLKVFP